MSAYQAGAARVSSTMTKRNPRPRKYATASERQAAYRDRAPEVCFRAEATTVETLNRIAAKNDRSRAELLLSMTKFALANHDWARFGLTHRPLPYGYGLAEQEFVGPRLSNPSPYADPALWEEAKAAARKRMGGHSARAMQLAGRLYRAAGGRYVGKRTKAQKSLERWTDQDWTTKSGKPSRETGERYLPRKVIAKLTPAEYGATTRAKREGTAAGQQFVKQPARIAAKVARLKGNPTMKKPTPAQLAARARFAEMARSGAFKRKAKRNSAKKTVSQKISQLVHEGYPQKQAVAIALSEERAGKVKRNPRASNPAAGNKRINFILDGESFSLKPSEFYFEFDGIDLTVETNKSGIRKPILSGYGVPQDVHGEYALFAFDTKWISENDEKNFQRLVENFVDEYDKKNMTQVKRNPATGTKKSRTKLNPATGTKKSRTKLNPATGTKKSRTKLNPATGTKKSRTKLNPTGAPYKYALVVDDGGFSFGMDSRTPVEFVFSRLDRKKGIYRSFAIPDGAVKNPAFQRWASSLPENSTIMTLDQLRGVIKGYMA